MDGAGMVNSMNTLPLRNVLLLAELIERVQNRNDVLPGMACFYGHSGLGKTSAAAWCANRYDAYHVEMKNTWSPTKFAQKIVTSLGMTPKGRLGDLVEIIGEELLKSGRPLLIDEGHLLANTRMVGVVYDIYESSKGTIILIGEKLMPQTLTRWERCITGFSIGFRHNQATCAKLVCWLSSIALASRFPKMSSRWFCTSRRPVPAGSWSTFRKSMSTL